MKIAKQFKLENAVSDDETRPAIANVLVAKTKTGTVAVATNGRIMAVVPVEVEGDNDFGLVSPKALVQARKVTPKRDTESAMSLNGNIAFVDGSALPRPTEQDCGTFPRWEQILPQADQKLAFTVALNPRLLLALAEAIGCDKGRGVTLQFHDEMSPIVVTLSSQHRDSNGAKGVLMPMRA